MFCGNKIAFVSDRDSPGTHDLWVMNMNGSNPVNLTPNTAGSNEYEPHCQPDTLAPEIVFRREASGQRSDIYMIKSDGTGLKQLTDHWYDDINPQWCGDRILFVRNLFEGPTCMNQNPPPFNISNPGNDYQLFLMKPQGEICHTCEPAREITCANNPNNSEGCGPTNLQAVLFYWPSCRVNATGGIEIVASAYTVANYNARQIFKFKNPLCESGCCVSGAGDLDQLTNTPLYDNDYPSWSSGGASIAFASRQPDENLTPDWEIYKMRLSDLEQTQLTFTGSAVSDEDPHWGEKED